MATSPINKETRLLDQALADLVAKHEKQPTPGLARMIRQLELEIVARKSLRVRRAGVRGGGITG